jgi:hypothetical protein
METKTIDYRKTGFWQLVLLAFLLTFVTQAFHEAFHWIVYEIAGLKPVWGFSSLVQIWGDKLPLHLSEWVATTAPDGSTGWLRMGIAPGKTIESVMLSAGPLASLLITIIGLCLMRWNSNPSIKKAGLMIGLITSITMGQHYMRSFSQAGGDEYFLAGNLGIPTYVINIPLGIAFITTLILGFHALYNWKTMLKWLGAILVGSIPAGVFLMFSNTMVKDQIDLGNRLFQPILGWSLPVIAVNLLVLLLLGIWWKRTNSYNSF